MSDHIFITADDAGIDTDEGRYVLRIWGDQGEDVTVDIHSFVLDFYASVQKEIRPYVLEAESARSAVARGVTLPEYLDSGYRDEPGSGYALDDPKHPTYHERMVGDA